MRSLHFLVDEQWPKSTFTSQLTERLFNRSKPNAVCRALSNFELSIFSIDSSAWLLAERQVFYILFDTASATDKAESYLTDYFQMTVT